MKNMLAGAFLATMLTLGVFAITLTLGARLLSAEPEVAPLTATPLAPPAMGDSPPTLAHPTMVPTAGPTTPATTAPSPTAPAPPSPPTPSPTPAPRRAEATPTFPAPLVLLTPAPTEAVAASLPDLVVTWLVPTYAWQDEDTAQVSISVTVRNQGAAPAVGFWVTAYVDDQPEAVLHRASLRWFVADLSPGLEIQLNPDAADFGAELLLAPGDYLLTAVVNSAETGDPIAESDRSNNTLGPLALPLSATAALVDPAGDTVVTLRLP